MKKTVCILISGMMLMALLGRINQSAAQRETASAEAFLKKYAMAEAFEIGIELAVTSPDSEHIGSVERGYITLAHTTNEHTTFKLRWGYLLADYRSKEQTIGELEHLPLMLTWLNSLSPSPRFKPYIGGGIAYYYYDNFRPRKAVKEQYHKYKDIHNTTIGYHLLTGIKYISQKRLCVSLDISHEWVESFHLKDSRKIPGSETFKVDLSSWAWGLNLSLRF